MKLDRTKRVGVILQRAITEIMRRHIEDPRIDQWVSVTEVEVSKDLAFAKVFVSQLDLTENLEGVVNVLNGASGYVRSHISDYVDLRCIPNLKFYADDTIAKARHISNLLEQTS